ncbi:hypothetical protein COCOBI_13-1270 [Coccomyxa sp. Obi]|nr:hypothetical protein COCOBI_13-1270 [Coccomyxa sp. Obi]
MPPVIWIYGAEVDVTKVIEFVDEKRTRRGAGLQLVAEELRTAYRADGIDVGQPQLRKNAKNGSFQDFPLKDNDRALHPSTIAFKGALDVSELAESSKGERMALSDLERKYFPGAAITGIYVAASTGFDTLVRRRYAHRMTGSRYTDAFKNDPIFKGILGDLVVHQPRLKDPGTLLKVGNESRVVRIGSATHVKNLGSLRNLMYSGLDLMEFCLNHPLPPKLEYRKWFFEALLAYTETDKFEANMKLQAPYARAEDAFREGAKAIEVLRKSVTSALGAAEWQLCKANQVFLDAGHELEKKLDSVLATEDEVLPTSGTAAAYEQTLLDARRAYVEAYYEELIVMQELEKLKIAAQKRGGRPDEADEADEDL